mmetsp:Transcript_22811/g.53286  ORF Transcript_22811/g.53286 Transcript_22811/m.53286 type:complete len:468 (-) Transcript_22811:292-1695(-)
MPSKCARRGAGPQSRDRIRPEDVKDTWRSLDNDARRAALRIEDITLVERIRGSLQALWANQVLMQQMGLAPVVAENESSDPFEESIVLKQMFEFTWDIARSAQHPNTVLVDPLRHPVMAVKLSFLEAGDVLAVMQRVLPDFLLESSGRAPLPQAKWKDLFSTDPPSVVALEKQLAKLVEQALWIMHRQHCKAGQEAAKKLCVQEDTATASADQEIVLEPWMAEYDAKAVQQAAAKGKKSKKSKKQGLAVQQEKSKKLETMKEVASERDATSPRVLRHHYWQSPLQCGDQSAPSSWHSGDGCDRCGEEIEAKLALPEDLDTKSESDAAESCPATPCGRCEDSSNTPSRLVNYIWGQTAQLPPAESVDADADADECYSPRSCSTSEPLASEDLSVTSPSHMGTPWSRGSWAPTPPSQGSAVTVVVRKTFIDIEVPENGRKTRRERIARSLSPRPSADVEDEDPWRWYWH